MPKSFDCSDFFCVDKLQILIVELSSNIWHWWNFMVLRFCQQYHLYTQNTYDIPESGAECQPFVSFFHSNDGFSNDHVEPH